MYLIRIGAKLNMDVSFFFNYFLSSRTCALLLNFCGYALSTFTVGKNYSDYLSLIDT